MSIAISINPKRDDDSGRVLFQDWPGLNDYEKVAAKIFEDGVESTLLDFPPTMYVDVIDNDVAIKFDIAGLGDGDDGPAWTFSLKDALRGIGEMCEPDDIRLLVKAMRELADYAESQTQ